MLVCNFVATDAYKASGGKAKHPDRAAEQIHKIPQIKQRIEELKDERSKRTEIDADYVLRQTDIYLRRCMGDESFVKTTTDEDGKTKEVQVKQFNPTGVGKALELMGKHVNVGAFKENIELEAGKSLAELMREVAKE